MTFDKLQKAVIKLNVPLDALIIWEVENSGSKKTEAVFIKEENRLYISDAPDALVSDVNFSYSLAQKPYPTITRYKMA